MSSSAIDVHLDDYDVLRGVRDAFRIAQEEEEYVSVGAPVIVSLDSSTGADSTSKTREEKDAETSLVHEGKIVKIPPGERKRGPFEDRFPKGGSLEEPKPELNYTIDIQDGEDTLTKEVRRSQIQILLKRGSAVEVRTAPDDIDEFDVVAEVIKYSFRKNKYQVKIIEHVSHREGEEPPEECTPGKKLYVPRKDIRLPPKVGSPVLIADPDKRDDVDARVEKLQAKDKDYRFNSLLPSFQGWYAGKLVKVDGREYVVRSESQSQSQNLEERVNYADVHTYLPESIRKIAVSNASDNVLTARAVETLFRRVGAHFATNKVSAGEEVNPNRKDVNHIVENILRVNRKKIPVERLLNLLWAHSPDSEAQKTLDQTADKPKREATSDRRELSSSSQVQKDSGVVDPAEISREKSNVGDFWRATDSEIISQLTTLNARASLRYKEKLMSEEEEETLLDLMEPSIKLAFSALKLFSQLRDSEGQDGERLPLPVLLPLLRSMGIYISLQETANAIHEVGLTSSVKEAKAALVGTDEVHISLDDAISVIHELVIRISSTGMSSVMESRLLYLFSGSSESEGLSSHVANLLTENGNRDKQSRSGMDIQSSYYAAVASRVDIASSFRQSASVYQASETIGKTGTVPWFAEEMVLPRNEFINLLCHCGPLALTHPEAVAIANDALWCDTKGAIDVCDCINQLKYYLLGLISVKGKDENCRKALLKLRNTLLASPLSAFVNADRNKGIGTDKGPCLWLLATATLPAGFAPSLLSLTATSPMSSLSHQLYPRVSGDPTFSALTDFFLLPEGQTEKDAILGEGYEAMSGRIFGIGTDGAGLRLRLYDIMASNKDSSCEWVGAICDQCRELLFPSVKRGSRSEDKLASIHSNGQLTRLDRRSQQNLADLTQIKTGIVELGVAKNIPRLESQLLPAVVSRQVRLVVTDTCGDSTRSSTRRTISNQHICTAAMDIDSEIGTETWYLREKPLIKALEHCDYRSRYFDEKGQEELSDFELSGSAETAAGTFVIRSNQFISNQSSDEDNRTEQQLFLEFTITMNLSKLIDCIEKLANETGEEDSVYQEVIDKFEELLDSEESEKAIGEVEFTACSTLLSLSELVRSNDDGQEKKKKSKGSTKELNIALTVGSVLEELRTMEKVESSNEATTKKSSRIKSIFQKKSGSSTPSLDLKMLSLEGVDSLYSEAIPFLPGELPVIVPLVACPTIVTYRVLLASLVLNRWDASFPLIGVNYSSTISSCLKILNRLCGSVSLLHSISKAWNKTLQRDKVDKGLLHTFSDIIWACWAECKSVYGEEEPSRIRVTDTETDSTHSKGEPEIRLNVGQRLSLLIQCKLDSEIEKSKAADESTEVNRFVGDTSDEECFAPFSIEETILSPV
eukprot:gb/GECG01004783.1/.p1 GENE.gb/GECG01004783.1/~~gb/GECG01004783.1/.p1  ORF type:complete len:1379 (+),score=208.94 gb/GECG01004783.1/:1-4137(+)